MQVLSSKTRHLSGASKKKKKPSKLIYPVTTDMGQERGKYSFQWLKIVFPYAH